jgi:predicted RecB family endonuclease
MAKVTAVSWKAGMVPLKAVSQASRAQSSTAEKPMSVAAVREGRGIIGSAGSDTGF